MRLILTLVIFALFALPGPFTFTGMAVRGEGYSKALPGGLEFRLTAADCGWIADILDSAHPDLSYTWPENPPWRGKNVLYFDDSYDGDWKTALKGSHEILYAGDPETAKQYVDWADAMNRGATDEARRILPKSAHVNRAKVEVLGYRAVVVRHKSFGNAKDNTCPTDLRFRVTVEPQ